jgi:hypothetical protein
MSPRIFHHEGHKGHQGRNSGSSISFSFVTLVLLVVSLSDAEQGDALRPGLPGAMLSKGFIGEKVEFPGGRVSFDLAIPTRLVILNEPLTQPRQGVVIESLYLLLNLFNVGHAVLRSTPIVAQTSQTAERWLERRASQESLLVTRYASLLLNRAHGHQIVVEHRADVMDSERHDRLCLPGHANKFHLDPLGIVDLDDCAEIPLPQPVLGKVSIEYDCIQQMTSHDLSPGNAVTKRGHSGTLRIVRLFAAKGGRPE